MKTRDWGPGVRGWGGAAARLSMARAHGAVARAGRDPQFGGGRREGCAPRGRSGGPHAPAGVVGDDGPLVRRRPLRLPAREEHGRQEEAREVGAMCPAAHSNRAHPRRKRRWASVCAGCAAPPSLPRGIYRWRERRGLLASGGRLAFPGEDTQWRRAVTTCPLQWRGGGRPPPASPISPSPFSSYATLFGGTF